MSIIAPRPYSVTFSDEPIASSGSGVSFSGSSSPANGTTLIPSTSSSGRSDLVPLAPAKTIVSALTRRGVIFSPRNDTKLFHSTEAIIPSCDAPPRSIRSYLNTESEYPSPHASPSDYPSPHASPSQSHETPRQLYEKPSLSLSRGILKRREYQIRVAASVEEGTLNNKEAARLLVSGKRPQLVARDSFQLAVLRKAASDGMALPGPADKGKGRMLEDAPGSDDSTASNEPDAGPSRIRQGSTSSEEEEAVEEDGALATGSLINIILEGAEDLLTLEEAYNTLTLRLRQRIRMDEQATKAKDMLDDIRVMTQPIRDEAPAMVRAMQRDLQRLLGKVPNAEILSSDSDISPFRALRPLQCTTPKTVRAELTPSPTPIPPSSRNGAKQTPDSARQGYNEAEVRYRREASGVGAALLRFIAFAFSTAKLYSCFSEADLQSILDQVMVIPRTPKLPTPNPKRTYFLSILILANLRLPAACVQPVKDKIARAIESSFNDGLATPNTAPGGKEAQSQSQIRKESYNAVTNLVATYPSIFFYQYAEMLPGCLRGLASPAALVRSRAAAAVSAFGTAKLNLLSDCEERLQTQRGDSSRETWMRLKTAAQKCEFFVISHYKSALRTPGTAGFVYGHTGDKKTEWTTLEQMFKDTVGTTDVYWACAIWATLVSLMGSAYCSSGLATSFDHIMDRSLQPSTNGVRPLLARTAWNHAIHAYLSSGSVASVSADGHLVRSYKPFVASGHHDVAAHVAMIELPVDLALTAANDSASVTKVLIEGSDSRPLRYTWQRVEKSKKMQWMVTCGLGAAAVVYAYTGMAQQHKDQPAREMSAISGLPSSDGAPVPESSLEESKLDRLDRTWAKVVSPLLYAFGSIHGVDRLKLHGWAIFEALTAANGPSASWTLNRLLCPGYLSGEVYTLDKDDTSSVSALLEQLESESIKPAEIPAWGAKWVVRRLDSLLKLFDASLSGISGLNDLPSKHWAKSDNGASLIPLAHYRIWSNLLRALATVKQTEGLYGPTFTDGLRLVTRFLIQVFNRDPINYSTVSDVELTCVSIDLFSLLFDAAVALLGRDAVAAVRLSLGNTDVAENEATAVDAVLVKMAFGSDNDNKPTMVGCLLGQLLRTQALSYPLQPEAKASYKRLIEKLLNAGCISGFYNKLLGDMTNQMPWIFQDQEEVQLDVWRLLALKWTETIDLAPSAAASSTNHTGALLVSLLSNPFRGRQITSAWHQHASQEDLAAWQALLEVAVLRFRAKRVGSNLGVLESLAGHLGDFLEEGEKTSSSTITLSCLASAASWISFGPTEYHHASHFNINENYVPVDFLTLLSNALLEAYPRSETLATSVEVAISPAIAELIEIMRKVFDNMPGEYIKPVLESIKTGLAVWLSDDAKIANEAFAATLDSTFVTLLKVIGRAVGSGHIAATAELLDELIEIYAPRLSRARSTAVPQAFQSFWQCGFQHLKASSLSDDVAIFLQDVLAAVPGMIDVPGLTVGGSFSQQESMAKYPHAQEIIVAPEAASKPTMAITQGVIQDTVHEILVDTTVITTDEFSSDSLIPEISAEYDADVSQSIDDSLPFQPSAVREALPIDTASTLSPNTSKWDSEERVSRQTSPIEVGDVFGPAGLVSARDGKRKGGQKRSLGKTYSMPEAKRPRTEELSSSSSLPHLTAAVAPDDDELDDCIVVHQSPERPESKAGRSRVAAAETIIPATISPSKSDRPSRPSLLASASNWLRNVPSFGLFSPAHPEFEQDPSHIANSRSDRADRIARRASRIESGQSASSVSEPETSAVGRKRAVPVVEISGSRHPKRRRTGSEIHDEPVMVPAEDEEDELLLSVESARKRRREEEGAIAAAEARKVVALASPAPANRALPNQEDSQISIGRFDDAPGDVSLPRPRLPGSPATGSSAPPDPTSSTKRTSSQSRILAMVEEAARAKELIEKLNFNGVVALLGHVDQLRAAATANLQKRAEDGRKGKRKA